LYGAVTAGRQLRNDNGIEPRKKVSFVIKPSRYADFFKIEVRFLTQILSADTVTIDPDYAATGLTPSLVTQTATVFMVGAVDPATERQRLTKQLADIEKQLSGTEAKLANESFVSKAAPIAVQRERDRQEQLREQREKIQALLRALQ
jgi:valyl-tRNA synthetase